MLSSRSGRLFRETGKQQGATLTGVLQPCEGCLGARRGTAEDDIAGGEAGGNRAHRPGSPLPPVNEWIGVTDHVR